MILGPCCAIKGDIAWWRVVDLLSIFGLLLSSLFDGSRAKEEESRNKVFR